MPGTNIHGRMSCFLAVYMHKWLVDEVDCGYGDVDCCSRIRFRENWIIPNIKLCNSSGFNTSLGHDVCLLILHSLVEIIIELIIKNKLVCFFWNLKT